MMAAVHGNPVSYSYLKGVTVCHSIMAASMSCYKKHEAHELTEGLQHSCCNITSIIMATLRLQQQTCANLAQQPT